MTAMTGRDEGAEVVCCECKRRLRGRGKLPLRTPEQALAFSNALSEMPDGGPDEDFERERYVMAERRDVFD